MIRQIELLGEFLGRILSRIDAREMSAARTEISNASQNLLGFDFATLAAMPPDQLTSLLTSGGEVDPGKAYIAAKLFALDAQLAESEVNDVRAFLLRCQALHLAIEAYKRSDTDFAQLCEVEIQARLEELIDYDLPDFVTFQLIDYYEKCGRYARAEDALFNLCERAVLGAKDRGERFYAALSKISDELLIAGNLPREELARGLSELRAHPSPLD